MRLVIRTTDKWNIRLANVLDADLKITLLQNVQSHQKDNEKWRNQVRFNEKVNFS